MQVLNTLFDKELSITAQNTVLLDNLIALGLVKKFTAVQKSKDSLVCLQEPATDRAIL
jgi:hypothetical protein